MKNNKGITLMALVITIIILFILSSIVLYSAKGAIDYSKYNKAKATMEVMQNNVNSWYDEYKNAKAENGKTKEEIQQTIIDKYKDSEATYNTVNFTTTVNKAKDQGITLQESEYSFISKDYIKNNLGMDNSFEFLVNIPKRVVILFGGIKSNGEQYFTTRDFGIVSVEDNPISDNQFTIKQGIDKDIIISDLKFSDASSSEVNVSKFKVQYAKSGTQDWRDVTDKVTKYTDKKDNKIKYRFPVGDYGDYVVKVSSTDQNVNNTATITVRFKGNAPELKTGMIPIRYDETKAKWVICEQTDEEWYDYTSKRWANIMLSDGTYKSNTAIVGTEVEDSQLGSMFVWIPRYAYSITRFKTSANGEGTTQSITDISLLKGTSNNDQNGTTYEDNYDVDTIVAGNPTPKILHPGFNFDGDELTGFWVAKFKASMSETNNNTVEDNNVITKTMKILPNSDSWRYITIGNSFFNCLNMKDNSIYGISNLVDTHLMKNKEWGAIAYFSVSQYGFTPTMNNGRVSYQDGEITKFHIYTGGNNYRTNVTQSSTGNETGIYDLNGGAWEFTATFWNNKNNVLSTNGTSTVFPSNQLNPNYTKYWDKYEVSENEIFQMNDGLWDKDYTANSIRKSITDDRYNLLKDIKGDAMYEVINTYSYYGKYQNTNTNTITYGWLIGTTVDIPTSLEYGSSWYNSDYSLIGNSNLDFLLRGGTGTAVSGIFAIDGFGRWFKL